MVFYSAYTYIPGHVMMLYETITGFCVPAIAAEDGIAAAAATPATN